MTKTTYGVTKAMVKEAREFMMRAGWDCAMASLKVEYLINKAKHELKEGKDNA